MKIDVYLGIPFAEPPIGELRFKRPQPLTKKWDNILLAKKFASICPQSNQIASILSPQSSYSENCLYLNVWTPNSQEAGNLRPVIFIVHGGAFIWGSASDAIYNGLRTAFKQTKKFAEITGCLRNQTEVDEKLSESIMHCLRNLNLSTIIEKQLLGSSIFNYELSFSPIYGDAFMPKHPVKAIEDGDFKMNSTVLLSLTDYEALLWDYTLAFNSNFSFLKKCKDKNKFEEFVKTIVKVNGRWAEFDDILKYYFDAIANIESETFLDTFTELLADYRTVCPVMLLGQALTKQGVNVYIYKMSYKTVNKVSDEWSITRHSDRCGHFEDVRYAFGVPFQQSEYDENDRKVSEYVMQIIANFSKHDKLNWNKLHKTRSEFIVIPFVQNIDKYGIKIEADYKAMI
ncbi:para-nitrobenzyl esterase-like protein, partial [Dinothrombium tinctorium]